MNESIVRISMRDENDLDCSYAIIDKNGISVIIILKDKECAIFDYNNFKDENDTYRYLLLKHYEDTTYAYKDFMKLIGKMCKKSENSKYFLNHIDEDNRIVFVDFINEHEIMDEEKNKYEVRYRNFEEYILKNKNKF